MKHYISKQGLNRLTNALIISYGVGCGAFFYSQAVLAESQDALELDQAIELESYVVTGSYIPRSGMDSITPVTIIDRDKIERSGATTLNELFQKSILNAAGVMDEQFTQSFAPGTSGINLRGLGVSRTLVLLDGRRMPIFPFAQSRLDKNDQSSFVNINVIPLSAVERIEILKDGASAMYGADAVAGVVNIITHKDYDGVSLTGQYGATLKVDGEEGQAKILAGKTWEKTNVTLAFDYLNRSDVKSRDRHISDSALGSIDNRSKAGNPGTIIDFGPSAFPPSGPPVGLAPDARCSAEQISGGFCTFDFAPFTTLIPEVERSNFMGSLEHEFNDQFSFFARGMYSHTWSSRSLAPGTLDSGDLLFLNPSTVNNSSDNLLGVIYRFTELGSRVSETTTETFNFVSGFTGEFAEWDWELAGGIGSVETIDKGVSGFASETALQNAVDFGNGTLNLLGESPDFDVADVKLTPKRTGESEIYYVDFKTNGTLLDLPQGNLKLAVGAEYRHESYSDTFDEKTLSGDVTTLGGVSGGGSRDIEAAYFEFYATVLEQLEMQFAGRFDYYSDFGATFNPKFSLRWEPIQALAIRGNVGTGFKTPALHELYSGEINAREVVFDPTKGELVDVELISQGNPDLDAEESFSYGVGFAWDATDWWQLSLDYWNIRNDDAVVSSPQFYVDNEAEFGNVTRDASGEITSVTSPFNNVSGQRMWGLDMHTSLDWEQDTLGYFRLDANGTYLGSFKEEIAPGRGFTEYAGKDGVVRWRAQGSLTWTKSDYEMSVTTNFVDGYTRVDFNDKVDSWTTFDLQAVWRPVMLQGTTIRVGSNNVLDTAPPEDVYFEKWPFFNRALANPRGRFLYLQAQYEF